MKPDLDRQGLTPIYHQLVDWIREQVDTGRWPEGHKLPAEIDLADDWDVSRGTIRKATEALIEEGYLVRIHGRGTFVAATPVEQPLAERLLTFSEDLAAQNIPFETHVLSQGMVEAPAHIASSLALPQSEKVFLLKRLRSVQGRPFTVMHNYIAHHLCPEIVRVDFTRYRLFEAFEELLGLRLEWGQRTFQALMPPQEIAALLEMGPYEATMYLEQIVYLASGHPVELSNDWIRGDRFKLTARVSRSGDGPALPSSQQFNVK